MGGFKEYDQYDGLGLAELIRKKQVPVSEICQAAIERIDRLNPQLNAVVTNMVHLAEKSIQSLPSSGKPA